MSFHTHRACLICSYALHLFLTTSPAPASEVRMVPRRVDEADTKSASGDSHLITLSGS